MATIPDLPPEIMLMVTAYLQGEDVLNLQLTDRRMNSLTTDALYRIFFSERHFELSSRGFEQLYALSVHPHARHVKTIIIRFKIKSKPTAKYLTLLDRAFRNFGKYGKLSSIGVRRDQSVAHQQHFVISKRSHAIMREFLVARMIPAASKAKLPLESIIYDFEVPKDQNGSDRPLTCQLKQAITPSSHREQIEAAESLWELPTVVPKHLDIVVRFVSPEQPLSECPTAKLSQQHETLALLNTSVYHHDILARWLHNRQIKSLSFRNCDLDALHFLYTLHLRLGQLWVGAKEQYVEHTYEAQGHEMVGKMLGQLFSRQQPSLDFLVQDKTVVKEVEIQKEREKEAVSEEKPSREESGLGKKQSESTKNKQ
ncbi:hypothetical protein D6C87_09376 [Aureobasidium pullulans]|uniref:F-box domain-containing protein n=1 Tax=Aureobasidium pullulans TaxID=5580 RepID=A0AB38LL33_AURPU|nr:hypothetical protein D6C94_09090 [Aureobasidium pullulans]THZ36108.1 hypothetical protein D6C87_09376 [Aureobasidium pullulans]